MGERNRDDVAEALTAMAGGADSGRETPAGLGQERADSDAAARGEVGDDVRGRLADDDAVIAPAPDPSVFAPRVYAPDVLASGRAARDLDASRRLERKRTLIPILLTLGALLPAIASLKWLAGDESPFAAWDLWVPVVMCTASMCLIALAALNMLQVRHVLRNPTLRNTVLRNGGETRVV
jgi:hypothetical protein